MIYTIGADVATLVQALQNPGDASKQRAVYALSLLTKSGAPGVHRTSAKLIAAAGGVHSLVELVRNGSASLTASATIVLAHLARSYAEKILIGSEPNFIALLIEHAGAGSAAAVRAIRALAHNHFGHRVAISEAGGVETLVALERRKSAIASDALRVLAQNDVIHAKIVAYRGGVRALYFSSLSGRSYAAFEMYVHLFLDYRSIVHKCLVATVVPADLELAVMAFLTGPDLFPFG